MMRKSILAATLAALLAPTMPALADPPRHAPAHGWREKQSYKHHRADRWYPERHYRDGRNYKARRLSANERIWRGNDGRYYCKRKDGTTGLIIGALAGGLLGNQIAPGDSKTIGTILGGGAGALIGKSLDDGVRCR